MKGQTYLQSAMKGMEREKTVRFEDQKSKNLEYCHNLITQTHPDTDKYVEYGYDFAMLIARTMTEFQDRVSDMEQALHSNTF